MTTRPLTIAIAGNPNSGKTTIFNALAGTRQHVGNYPGVTVEKKEGRFVHAGRTVEVVDLPGTYSLEAASLDERVARDFLVQESPDVVVDVVDAHHFERHAYLTAQLLELGVRLVLVLNMSDRARASGQDLDLAMIRDRLGCEVVETVGTTGEGLPELKEAILRAAGKPHRRIELDYGEELGEAVEAISAAIRAGGAGRMAPFEDRWIAMKLLEGDAEAEALLGARVPEADAIGAQVEAVRAQIEGHHGDVLAILFAERRHGFAAGLYREVVRREIVDRQQLSDRIDNVMTNRWLGIPLFLAIVYAVFWITFTVGEVPMGWIERGIGWLGTFVAQHWPGDGALKSLVVDGIIDGVGGVIVFLPNIVLLFMGIALLEDTGYMARAAFLMDRLMHKIGLHGKSFIPMLIGFGCSVPAIMATRTLEHRRDRLATMFVIPLMSCGARLPIYALFIPAFFPVAWRPRVLFGIYAAGVLLAIVIVRLLRSTVMRGESLPFVMELPPYRMPTAKGILIHMWERSALYLRKAGTIILGISIVMWFLTAYPKPAPVDGVEAPPAVALEYSVAGRVGHALGPVMRPLGFDWRINTALLGSFAAKEVFVSQLGIVFSIGEADEESVPLREEIARNYTPLVGLCVMLFCLIATPCMATLAVTRRESGSAWFAVLQFAFLTAVAYLVTFVVYQLGRLLGF